MTLPPGLAARLRVRRELGRGACGTVWLAAPRAGGPEVAVKLFPVVGDGARQARELSLAQKVRHPHLMATLEAGVEGDLAYLVMPRASGSLEARMGSVASRREAWRLLREAACGVAALHACGMIHRDLKPANILVVDGQARVSDFGMARDEASRTLTAAGMILGTPAYMAPEQARGERASPAADVYALGVIAFEVVEGSVPYPSGLAIPELLGRVAKAQRDGFTRARAEVRPEVLEAIERALAPAPGDRPVDLMAWAEALGDNPWLEASRAAVTVRVPAPGAAQVAARSPLVAGPGGPPRPAASTARRGWGRWLLLALGLAVGAWWGGSGPAPAAVAVPGPTAAPSPAIDREIQGLERNLEAGIEALGEVFLYQPGAPLVYQSRGFRRQEDRAEAAFQAAREDLLLAPQTPRLLSDYLYDLTRWVKRRQEARRPPTAASAEKLERYLARFPLVYLAAIGGLRRVDGIIQLDRSEKIRVRIVELHGKFQDFLATWPELFEAEPWAPQVHLARAQIRWRLGLPMLGEDVEVLVRALQAGPQALVTEGALRFLLLLVRLPKESASGLPCSLGLTVWRACRVALAEQPEGFPTRINTASLLAGYPGVAGCLESEGPPPEAELLRLARRTRALVDELAPLVVAAPPRASAVVNTLGAAAMAWRDRPGRVACELLEAHAATGLLAPEIWRYESQVEVPVPPSWSCP